MTKYFFTSDLHLQHENLLKFTDPRPYKTIQEHDQAIINNWNSVVTNDDIVYVLGDVSLHTDYDLLYTQLKQLNGKEKHLILGNHDKSKEQVRYLNSGIWTSIRDYSIINLVSEAGKQYEVVMFHYPILEFNHAFSKKSGKKYSIHLYGHIHNTNNYDSIYKELDFRAAHVGLDTSDKYPNTKLYTPINFENILMWCDNFYEK